MEKCIEVNVKEIEFTYDSKKERYVAQIEITNTLDKKSILSRMYITSFMKYTVDPSVVAIEPKQKGTITILLNKDVSVEEAKKDKFKVISIAFDENVTKLSHKEQKEKFKSVNKDKGYSIELTCCIHKEKEKTPKKEEKAKIDKTSQDKASTIKRGPEPLNPVCRYCNQKTTFIVFIVSFILSYYLFNRYLN